MLRLFSLLLSVLLLHTAAAAAPPRVVASIKPLHSLVSYVMQGVTEPHLLLSDNESPHHVYLKPSQRQLLAKADIVFYVAPELETFLKKPLSQLPTSIQKIALIESKGLTLLPARAHDHGKHPEHLHSPPKSPALYDTHIWLSPDNAKVMVRSIAHVLSQVDPKHAPHYTENATQFATQLEQLDRQLREALLPAQTTAFMVAHDAYHYFEHQYGLHNVGAITLDPAQPPSARKLHILRQRIRDLNPACLFSEPQSSRQLIDTLVEGTSLQTAILDPLGTTLSAGPNMYFALLEQLGQAFTLCLTTSP